MARLFRMVTVAMLAASFLIGCASRLPGESEELVYYCIGGKVPAPPPDTWGPKYETEVFTYGSHRLAFGHSQCGVYPVSRVAHLKYQVNGQLVEKRFDLSGLTAKKLRRGVYAKTLEFFANVDRVEVRILTPVQGDFPQVEVVASQ